MNPKDSAESAALSRAITENETIWRRSGYRGIYERLLKSDYFTVPGVSKIVAIRRASFHEAIKMISLENSL